MTQQTTASSPTDALHLIEVKPGLKFSKSTLAALLPDAETALFFAKVYELDYIQVSDLLAALFHSNVANELFRGTHSTSLQSYIVQITDDYGDPVIIDRVRKGDVDFGAVQPVGEILPHLWEAAEIEVAQSIKDVANTLSKTVGLMPGRAGTMVFQSMMQLNRQRPTLGTFKAGISHKSVRPNLLVLDVSGSMSEPTVRGIVEDVVALSVKANAHLAIVSNSCTTWEPGNYSVDAVLRAAEYGGTQYETLKPLLDKDWGVVISVADYDSSMSAKQACARATGSVDTLLDVSLVNRPTFLAECIGQHAREVKPLLVASTENVIGSRW